MPYQLEKSELPRFFRLWNVSTQGDAADAYTQIANPCPERQAVGGYPIREGVSNTTIFTPRSRGCSIFHVLLRYPFMGSLSVTHHYIRKA